MQEESALNDAKREEGKEPLVVAAGGIIIRASLVRRARKEDAVVVAVAVKTRRCKDVIKGA